MLSFCSLRSDHEVEFEQCTEDQRKLLSEFKVLLCDQDNLPQINQFFKTNPELMSLRVRDENGRNVFLLSCEKGRVDVLDLIVKRNLGVDFLKIFDCDKNSGMHLASYTGRTGVVKYLAQLDVKFLSEMHLNFYRTDSYKAAVKFGHDQAASEILKLRENERLKGLIPQARL